MSGHELGRPAGDVPTWAWFGKPTGAPNESDWPRIESPGGRCDCGRCREPILPNESGFVLPFFNDEGERRVVQHRDCYLLSIGVGEAHGNDHSRNCDEFTQKVWT